MRPLQETVLESEPGKRARKLDRVCHIFGVFSGCKVNSNSETSASSGYYNEPKEREKPRGDAKGQLERKTKRQPKKQGCGEPKNPLKRQPWSNCKVSGVVPPFSVQKAGWKTRPRLARLLEVVCERLLRAGVAPNRAFSTPF